MTANELRRFFPTASASTIRANTDADPVRIRPTEPQQDPASKLDGVLQRKEKSAERIANRVILRITGFLSRPYDPDNFAGGCKAVIDQLRYAGLIKNDSPEHIRLEVEQVKVKTKAEQKTVIEIYEIKI